MVLAMRKEHQVCAVSLEKILNEQGAHIPQPYPPSAPAARPSQARAEKAEAEETLDTGTSVGTTTLSGIQTSLRWTKNK